MTFSVVIPACDRPALLRDCLRRVMDQMAQMTPEGSYEVIVSDDSRTDGPRRVAEEFPRIQWVQGPRRGPAANRNCGARRATGEWLVFLDDDCLPDAGWLAAYGQAATTDADVLEGQTVCPLEDAFAFYEIVENVDGGAFWSCNLAVRRVKFEELGGFDEEFTRACAEDMEFAWRMRQRGLRSAFVEQALVTHPPQPMGVRDLLNRTAAHRWILLYRLKTGLGPGLACSASRAVAALVSREVLDKLRMIYHLWRDGDRRRIKGRTLDVLWRCASLPLFFPYYAYWELEYRRRQRGSTRAVSV